MRVEQPHESNCIAIARGRRSRRHAAATAGALRACRPTEERLGGYGLALSGQTSRTGARTRAMASQHSGAMPGLAHRLDAIAATRHGHVLIVNLTMSSGWLTVARTIPDSWPRRVRTATDGWTPRRRSARLQAGIAEFVPARE